LKPSAFEYYAPTTLAEAVEIKGRLGEDVTILAGGQSLIPLMNMRLARPTALLDLNHVRELSYIDSTTNVLVVGAMTRQRDVERSSIAVSACPLLAEALQYVGHTVIRNRGTIGGSVAHADPAAEIPATLVALRGEVTALGPRGKRTLPARDFFVSHFRNALASDEIAIEVTFPRFQAPCGFAFCEIARRHGDFALAGVAVVVRPGETRMALLGVGPTPIPFDRGDPDGAAAAAEPSSDIHTTAEDRRELVRALAGRALDAANRRLEASAL
jgi:carbon-monoxide dehydrogenase medium subunit